MNAMDVVVGNGAHAGAHKVWEGICLHAKTAKRSTEGWKDFDAHDTKAMAKTAVNVSNPDDAGAKYGEVRTAFGRSEQEVPPSIESIKRRSLTIQG